MTPFGRLCIRSTGSRWVGTSHTSVSHANVILYHVYTIYKDNILVAAHSAPAMWVRYVYMCTRKHASMAQRALPPMCGYLALLTQVRPMNSTMFRTTNMPFFVEQNKPDIIFTNLLRYVHNVSFQSNEIRDSSVFISWLSFS